MHFVEQNRDRKWKIPRTVLEARTWYFSSFGARGRKKGHFLYHLFCSKETFLTFLFYLNVWCIECTFRYTYFYKSKNITSSTFLLVFERSEDLSLSLI